MCIFSRLLFGKLAEHSVHRNGPSPVGMNETFDRDDLPLESFLLIGIEWIGLIGTIGGRFVCSSLVVECICLLISSMYSDAMLPAAFSLDSGSGGGERFECGSIIAVNDVLTELETSAICMESTGETANFTGSATLV